ncbi:MAG TPA: DNA polymerase [Ktedonobacter sp.]|nr:DNA polymerase [Ktedonobacter sp.]
MTITSSSTHEQHIQASDEHLFGWDTTQGIVSVWASRDGRAIVWRREKRNDGEHVVCTTERFRPWLFAASLADLIHIGPALQPHTAPGASNGILNYRLLDGPDDAYRYLLSARDGRFLERAICTGASQRLNRRITSVNELSDDYYRVGPVEQYLMLTGRVYFRGLVYEDLHRLQFDLETTALDPRRGRIFLIAVKDNRGFSTILEAPMPEDEPRLIVELCKLIRERDPDVIENHNLFGFDLLFLEQRAAQYHIPLELGRKGGPMLLERREETFAIGPEARKRVRYSVAGRELIDTLDAVRRHDFVVRDMPGHRLKEAARYFGIAPPNRVYIDGEAIFETYRSDPDTVKHYALDDVIEVDGLSRRLQGAPFALAGMAPRRYERVASAGPAMGILEPILVRAYLRANAALPRFAAQRSDDGTPHEGGATLLLAAGVAQQVVKADVASLYPSLMRTFQIGPSCDRLGVLLQILGQLTDLRLMHKSAAKQAVPNSIEANSHNATQAAMKILINAAYGYMGAGTMALFADGRAASEVTQRGRTVLNQVLDALRQRGMALIEADTDGVYFAVPDGWTEQQERALVDEIASELPTGIRLEYEGRYRAMLSHEVKNYALFTYDDRLVVHGVALRSSRAEPFGERFLRQVLPCTLMGDIVGVRRIFLETVDAIRNRDYPATDMGARVRLSKSPEAYLASRATHPEPQYEALLNAGRTRWFAGERVRFYRSADKKYVWLPEEAEEQAISNEWDDDTERMNEPQIEKANKENTAIMERFEIANRRDYDVDHYLGVLVTSYAARLKKAFAPQDFTQLFRVDEQLSFFDLPIEEIQPLWIRCTSNDVGT